MAWLVRRPLWQLWLVGGLTLIGVYFALPADTLPRMALYTVSGPLGAAAIVFGVRRNRPGRRLPWYAIATALMCSAAGDIIYDAILWRTGDVAYPGPADVAYLAAYPAYAVGMFVLIRSRTSGRDRAGLLDALIVATGLGLLGWTFLMRPIAQDHAIGVTERLASLAFPAGDLLLVVMLAKLLTSPGARTASFRLMILALSCLLVSDVTYSVMEAFGVYETGPVDAGWLLAYLTWGAAALHPSMRSLSEVAPDRGTRFGRQRLVLLAGASLLAPAILAYQGFTEPGSVDWAAISIGSVVLFLLVVFRMGGLVAQVQHQASQLAALAHNDGLTGVPNRRAWDMEVAREMGRAGRSGQQLIAGLIDLDHFKAFNDQNGHLAGDRLLKEAAAAWREQMRTGDLLARYGGEEFGVLFVGASVEDAIGVMQRLLGATPLGQTFSGGLAVWDGTEPPEQLVHRADSALYQAKRAGRSQVKLAVGAGDAVVTASLPAGTVDAAGSRPRP